MGHITRLTDPLGNSTSYEWNSIGEVTSVDQPDPDGAGPLVALHTGYQYDSYGNLTRIDYADGTYETWTYDGHFSQVTSHIDPTGRKTLYSIDPNNGNITSVTQVIGQVDSQQNGQTDDITYQFQYTTASDGVPLGMLKQIQDPLGQLTNFSYYSNTNDPQFGWLHTVTYAVGTTDQASVSYEYNTYGDVSAYTDELNRRTEYQYDALDELTKVTLPDPTTGTITASSPYATYEYCLCGEMISSTDFDGNETIYHYDGRRRLKKVIAPNPDNQYATNPTTIYDYDKAGNLIDVTDPMGHVTTYAYDKLNRQVQVTGPDPGNGAAQSITKVAYNPLGWVTSVTDALNQVTSYTYNAVGEVIMRTDPDPDGGGPLAAPVTQYSYDNVGNLLHLTDPNNNTTSWTYDDANRATSETNQLNATRSDVYDKAGNLIQTTDRDGRVIQYDYDHRNRETAERWLNGFGQTIRTIAYVPNAAGELTSVTDHDASNTPLSADYSYTYDKMGRTTGLSQTIVGLTPTVTFGQQFDANSNRKQLTATIGGTADFVNNFNYDALNRLTDLTQQSQTGGNTVALQASQLRVQRRQPVRHHQALCRRGRHSARGDRSVWL